MPFLPEGPPPGEVPHGRIWLDGADPTTLRMSGDVDQPVVVAAQHAITPAELAAVDVIDLGPVTFVDSSLISLVATLVLDRPAGRERLRVQDVPELALVVLEISGLLPLVAVTPRAGSVGGGVPEESDAS